MKGKFTVVLHTWYDELPCSRLVFGAEHRPIVIGTSYCVQDTGRLWTELDSTQIWKFCISYVILTLSILQVTYPISENWRTWKNMFFLQFPFVFVKNTIHTTRWKFYKSSSCNMAGHHVHEQSPKNMVKICNGVFQNICGAYRIKFENEMVSNMVGITWNHNASTVSRL